MKLNNQVQSYWEREPCGTSKLVVGNVEEHSLEWFKRVEDYRYSLEPFIHSVAQFSRYHGKKVLEVGVGAGTDHLQWARSGSECFGVDLTKSAVQTTKRHLSLHNFTSRLVQVDAEVFPFQSNVFDVVYSWGVIHHTENPKKAVR